MKLIAVLAGACLSLAGGAPGWYASGGNWTNRKAIVIDHTRVAGTSVLTNFPVLISLRDDDLKGLGKDILFTGPDGTSKVAHEIESYDPNTGALVAWVAAPQLSPLADTTLYLYFGNAAAASQANRTGVWDSSYLGVYHLGDADGTDLRDSTGRGASLLRGDKNHPVLDSKTGKITGAQLFGAGHTDYAVTGADDARTGPATLSLWILRSESYDKAGATGFVTRSIAGDGDIEFRSAPDRNTLGVELGGSYRAIAANVNAGWNYVVLVRNGASVLAYFNGKLAQTFAMGAGAPVAFRGLGNLKAAGSFAGEVDEVRWSSIDRSAEWIATEYANQSAPAAFFKVGPSEPAKPVPATAPVQLFRQPGDGGPLLSGTEDISKRTINARHFKNDDGTWTAVIGNNINTGDGQGRLVPVTPELWQTDRGGWQWLAGPLTVTMPQTATGHDLQHSYVGSDGSQHTLTLSFPKLTYAEKSSFVFTAGGQAWQLSLNPGKTAFSTVVTSPKGPQSYVFGYGVKGLSLAVNGAGHVAGDDGISLTRATMLRADGRLEPCSPWSIGNKGLAFTCDDSAFPAAAFPYTIHPVLSPPVANLQSCRVCYSGAGGCVNACTPGSYYSENENDSSGWYHSSATWTMDTSSIPANATVNSVAVNMTTSWGGSYTYSVWGTGNRLMGSCSSSQGTCNNIAAPVNSVAPGGATSLTGDCGNCGGYYYWDTGDWGYGSGMLYAFGLSVTYTYAPASITINTSPAGRTFTVDGTNYSTSETFQWTVGSQHTIALNTTTQPGASGTQYVWTGWSDAGGVSHTITTPASNTAYTANFKTQYYLTAAAPGVGGSITLGQRLV